MERNLVVVTWLYQVMGDDVRGGFSWGCIEMALDKSALLTLSEEEVIYGQGMLAFYLFLVM